MRKVSNLSFFFGAAFTVVLFMIYGLNNSIRIIGVNMPMSVIMMGVYFIIISAFAWIYGMRATYWTTILSLVIGLLSIRFSGWRIILTTTVTSIIQPLIALLVKDQRSIIVVAGTTFASIVALITNAVTRAIFKIAENFPAEIVVAILAGFMFGVLSGVMLMATKLVFESMPSIEPKHAAMLKKEE